MVVLMLVIVFGLWYGSQWALNTPYPALAVVSNSMQPTLNVGDVIIVQGISGAQVYANYINGDIVVFKSPSDPSFRIVHRAISKVNNTDGTWTITTHGDNNYIGADETFNSRDLIGKVVAIIPYVGNFSLFIDSIGNFYFFIIIIIILIGVVLSLFGGDEKKESAEKKSPENKKLLGRIDTRVLTFIILNVLLIGLIIFTLYGSYTFYQIGADPPQDVTIRGAYPNLQYYTTDFTSPYNNILSASLSQGFLTYSISSHVIEGSYEGKRPGVPTFSWMQISFIILILFDGWTIIKILDLDKKLRRRGKTETELNEVQEDTLKPKAL
jgi:signal peptidase